MTEQDKQCSNCVWRTVAMVALVMSLMNGAMTVAHAIFDAQEFQAIREHIRAHHPEKPSGE